MITAKERDLEIGAEIRAAVELIKNAYGAVLLPRNLKASGVPDNDFDRLSVAYGLSTMNLEAVRKMQPRYEALKTRFESSQTFTHPLY